jgi:hypothetical protein
MQISIYPTHRFDFRTGGGRAAYLTPTISTVRISGSFVQKLRGDLRHGLGDFPAEVRVETLLALERGFPWVWGQWAEEKERR